MNLISYFEQLNWTTAGWKHELFLDGVAEWGRNRITVTYDKRNQTYSTSYYNKRKRSHEFFKGAAAELAAWLLSSPIIDELTRNNAFDIGAANNAIAVKSKLTVLKAQETRDERDEELANEMLQAFNELCAGQSSESLLETTSVHNCPATSAAALSHKLTSRQISLAATTFCKRMDLPMPLDNHSDSAWAPKLFPTIVIESAIAALKRRQQI
jgi:hypothetical protein